MTIFYHYSFDLVTDTLYSSSRAIVFVVIYFSLAFQFDRSSIFTDFYT